MTCKSFTLRDPEPLPTFDIKLFEIISRFLVLWYLQPSLGFIEKRRNISRNRCTYLYSFVHNKYILINIEILHAINNHHKEVKCRCWQGPGPISYIPNIKKLFKFSISYKLF